MCIGSLLLHLFMSLYQAIELRVFKGFCIITSNIWSIMWETRYLILLFIYVLIAWTHTILHMLRGRSNDCPLINENGEMRSGPWYCPVRSTDFPEDPFAAFISTFFLMVSGKCVYRVHLFISFSETDSLVFTRSVFCTLGWSIRSHHRLHQDEWGCDLLYHNCCLLCLLGFSAAQHLDRLYGRYDRKS